MGGREMRGDATFLNRYRYAGHRLEDGGIVIDTDGEAKIRLDLCAADIVRLWADPVGRFEKPSSYAVADERWTFSEYEVECGAEELVVRTERLRVVVGKQPLRISYWTAPDEGSSVRITGERQEGGIGWGSDGRVGLRHDMGAEEHFYGLGQDNAAAGGKLDRRGSERVMTTGQRLEPGTVTANLPIPFFMSTGNEGAGGYGLFIDNTHRSVFDMGKSRSDSYGWEAEGGELVYYLMYGPSLRKVVERFTLLTGRPSLPPFWSLGFIQSRCSYQNWDEYDDVIEQFRRRGLPLDAMVFDYDWAEHMQNFRWHSRFEGKSRDKLAEYEKEGIRFLVSNSGPMIRKSSSNYASGWEAGVFARDTEGHPVTCGHYGGDLLDFTAPAIKDWLRPQLRPLFEDGIRGWWLDLTEPEGEPLQTVYRGGPRERIRNVYSLLNAKVYYELHREFDPEGRPFILTRTGAAGMQKYGAAVWTGDVYCDYDTLAAHCPEGLNAVLSGMAAWTSDSGGFISSTYDPADETHLHFYDNDWASQALLYERWLQYSCFCPIARAHHVGPAAPYEYGELAETGSRRYLQLRYRLLPYIYSCVRETSVSGLPLMRALVLDYQDDPAVYDIGDQYMFGEFLMVAPVLAPHAASREVYFPEGRWIDYDYGYLYEGRSRWNVYAPQNRIPVFVKAGAIIPMSEPSERTGELAGGRLTVDVYPAGRTSFVLYADDGLTDAWSRRGEYSETRFACEENGESVRFEIRSSGKAFLPEGYECLFHLAQTPVAVTDGAGTHLDRRETETLLRAGDTGWHWEPARRVLTVRLNGRAEGEELRIEIRLDGKPIPQAPAPEIPPAPARSERKRRAAGQGPFLLPPPQLPCRVQGENYDRGGEGASYHSLVPGNAGDLYRWVDINIEVSSDEGGGYCVFGLQAGEWLVYTVNAVGAVGYDLAVRYASEDGAGLLAIEAGGEERLLPLPDSGGPRNWATASLRGIRLREGVQTVKLIVREGRLRLNYMDFTDDRPSKTTNSQH